MAIEFGRTHIIGRSAGQTAIRAAAYRAGERLFDARTGLVVDYSHRADEVRHAEVLLPDGGDGALADRRTLWEAVETREDRHTRRATAQLARDHIVALPRELGHADQLELVRAFADEHFVSKGLVVDLAIHDHSEGNPHAHLMTTTRTLDGADFGPKARHENGAFVGGAKLADAEQLRHRWAAFQNRWMRERGIDVHAHVHDDERYRAEIHLGPARGMERREIRTQRGVLNDRIIDARTRTLLEHPEIVIDRVADRTSLFTRTALYREAHALVAEPDAFAALKARLDVHPSLVALRDPENGDREALTTARALELERRVRRIGRVLGRSTPTVAVPDAALGAAFGRHSYLSDEQREAARRACGSERLSIVIGLAGAGKSSMLTAVREAHEAVGRRVHGLALAGKAADELTRSSGIDASTIASWQLALASGRTVVEAGAVYVIDEAGMVGNRQMLAVLEAIERGGAKAILVGDAEQLQSIRAGCPFRDLARQEGAAEIGTIRRQRAAWQRAATASLARGGAAEAIDAYARAGCVHAGERAAMLDRLVADYLDAGDVPKTILAHRADDVADLNRTVRAARRAAGELRDGLPFHRGDPHEADARPPIDPEIGARVRFETDDRVLGCTAGEVGTWLGEEGGVRSVRMDDGRRIDFRSGEYDGVRRVHAPDADTIDIAVGDRVLFARNDRRLGVKNGMLGEVVRFDGTVATVRVDDGRTIDVDDRTYPHLEHGYATTVHKAQGMTVARAFLFAQGSMDRHLGYVAMSRHTDRLDVYLPDEEFATRSFVDAISRARRQASALDLARANGLEDAIDGPDGTGASGSGPRGGTGEATADGAVPVASTRAGQVSVDVAVGPGEPTAPDAATTNASAVPPAVDDGSAARGLAPAARERGIDRPDIDRVRGRDPDDPVSTDADLSAMAFDDAERVLTDAVAAHLGPLERAHDALVRRAREAVEHAVRARDEHARTEPRRGLFGPGAAHRTWSERGTVLQRDVDRTEAEARRRARDPEGQAAREARARALARAAHPDAVRVLAHREAIESGRRAHRSLRTLEGLREASRTPSGAGPPIGVERDIAALVETIRRNAAYVATLDAPGRAGLAATGERARAALDRDVSRGLDR